MKYNRTSTNSHLSTMATFFFGGQSIHWLLFKPLHNSHFFWPTVHTFTLVSTSLQWPLSSVLKVAVVERFNGNFFFTFCLYCSDKGLHLQYLAFRSLKCLWWQGGANFPHLQPMAELLRNNRREIGRQHVKVHYAAASVHADLTSPTQTNESICQIDQDTAAYVICSFWTRSTGCFTSPSNWSVRMKETRLTA